MLKKLEDELGVELFDRSPNRIYLNKTGEIALIHVNTILRNVEQMKLDLLSIAQQKLTISIAFCDPGVRWFCTPRFAVSHPEIEIKDDLYDGNNTVKLLTDRAYDIVVTPGKIQDNRIASQPFLPDQVFLSVPKDSWLLGRESISIREIPAQPLLYPQLGGYFLSQIEMIVEKEHLPLKLVKNNNNITQHLIRSTNFLATVSTLSIELRNDGVNRVLIPMSDPELKVFYFVSYLKTNRKKIQSFLQWSKECQRII